jgi:hypothetical protein
MHTVSPMLGPLDDPLRWLTRDRALGGLAVVLALLALVMSYLGRAVSWRSISTGAAGC